MSWQQQQAQWQSQGAGGPQGAHAGGHAQPHAPYGAAPFQPAGNGAGAPQDMSFMSFDLSGAAGQGGGVGPGGAGGSEGAYLSRRFSVCVQSVDGQTAAI